MSHVPTLIDDLLTRLIDIELDMGVEERAVGEYGRAMIDRLTDGAWSRAREGVVTARAACSEGATNARMHALRIERGEERDLDRV